MVFDFREVPCYEIHPTANQMADYFTHVVQGRSLKQELSDEHLAGAITLCGHTLAALFIKMLHRDMQNPMAVFMGLKAIGDMIGNLVQSQFSKDQKQLMLARGGKFN